MPTKHLATDVFLLSFFTFVIKVQSIYMRVWYILIRQNFCFPVLFWCTLNHIPLHAWELHAVALQISNYCGLLKKSTTLKTTHSNRYLYFCTVFKIKLKILQINPVCYRIYATASTKCTFLWVQSMSASGEGSYSKGCFGTQVPKMGFAALFVPLWFCNLSCPSSLPIF